jgi:hypothetical protein
MDGDEQIYPCIIKLFLKIDYLKVNIYAGWVNVEQGRKT